MSAFNFQQVTAKIEALCITSARVRGEGRNRRNEKAG
jgi:hypothetical protein